MIAHSLIVPSEACRRLKHRVETRMRAVGSGVYEYCYVCSLGHEMAMTEFGDEQKADEFVQSLRR